MKVKDVESKRKRNARGMRIANLLVAVMLVVGLVITQPPTRVKAAELLNVNFNSSAEGFVYVDDTFGTNQPSYATGSRITTTSCYGGSGGCLNVRLGGVNTNVINNMSGGWRYTFNLASAQTGVSLTLRYRLGMPAVYDYDEYSRVMVSLDGVLYGRGSRSYVDHTGGDNTFAHDTDWLQVSLYIGDVAAGSHNLVLGGFNNKKNASTEITDIYLDEVVMSSGNPQPVLSDSEALVGRLSMSNFKSNIQTLSNFGDRCRNSTSCAPYTSFNNAQAWVKGQLEAMGYTTYLQNYTYNGWTGSNLYATKVGSVHPDKMYMVTNHLDGRGGGGAADDNGSAVSLTLEIARVLASPDVQTDYSVRFIFFDQEEIGLYGSYAYVSDRRMLQGVENPAGSGIYPEPTWMGIINHDMIMYDHGVGTITTGQSVYADLDVEWRRSTTYATQSKALAQAWRFYNGEFASEYPANSADYSTNTDDTPFQPYTAAISVRENRRSLSGEWINPYYHKTTDIYANYIEDDFELGLNAVQTTLGTIAELSGAHIVSANNPPVADPQAVVTDEDTPVGVLLSGSDPDGDPLTYAIVSNPSHGMLSGTMPDLTYTPVGNFSGPDSFSYTVNDGTKNSDPALVSVTVIAVNDAPTVEDRSIITSEDTITDITLQGMDIDGDQLTYIIVEQPAHGSLGGAAPSLSFIPEPNYYGLDSFTFKVNDGLAESPLATVSLSISPVNDAPIADSQNINTTQNNPVPVTLSGSDIEGDILSYLITASPVHGSLTGTLPELTYTPEFGYFGMDSFKFLVNDGLDDSDQAIITITVGASAMNLPFMDDFESDKGWIVNPDGTDYASSGMWERANPQGTDSDGPKQLDITTSEMNNLVTGSLAGKNANSYDVDGFTTIRSPFIQLPAGEQIALSFQYYFAHAKNASSVDYFSVKVIGNTTRTILELRGTNQDVDATWKNFEASLNDFAGQLVSIQIEVGDLSKNSLVEAAVDDFEISVIQTSDTILSANFDNGLDTFSYLDDPFNTEQPAYATGSLSLAGGIDGSGALQVKLGGLDTEIVQGISGGWQTEFFLPGLSDVTVSIWFNLTQSADYDDGECSQVLLNLDGILYGSGEQDFIAQICGNGNGGIPESTGWQLFTLNLSDLPMGDHVLVIGGYNNQKSYTNEWTEIMFDQIVINLK